MSDKTPKRCCQNAAFGDPLLASIVERVREAYRRGYSNEECTLDPRSNALSEVRRELPKLTHELYQQGY